MQYHLTVSGIILEKSKGPKVIDATLWVELICVTLPGDLSFELS